MTRHTLPGTYMPVNGMTHRHATAEPGTVEHNHLGGGVPHDHDPETGFQMTQDEELHDLARKWIAQARHPMRAVPEREQEREALLKCAGQLLAALHRREDL